MGVDPGAASTLEPLAASTVASVATAQLGPAAIRGQRVDGTGARRDEKTMSNELYAEYNGAIEALMAARKLYADACQNQGAESWAAEQAQEYLTREVAHRD